MSTIEKVIGHHAVYIKVVYEDNPLMKTFLDFLIKQQPDLRWEHRIWMMPEGVTRPDLIKNAEKVFDMCEKYKLNFSSRSHILYGFV